MFTGIIETMGYITALQQDGSNVHITIASELSDALKIDQSVAHDGVCLTVVKQNSGTHTVTAIAETLDHTALQQWQVGRRVNLERALPHNGRLDGHLVQGHVDRTARCTAINEVDGSWYFSFGYQSDPEHLLVAKGSICIDGVSLTVVQPTQKTFQVAIIPYTYLHTTFGQLEVGQLVNLEFDVIGKYVVKWMQVYGQADR